MSEKSDSIARKILNDIAGTVNGTTNQCTTRIIFGDRKEPKKSFKEGITMPEHGQKINYITYRDWREVEGRVPHSVYCRCHEEEFSNTSFQEQFNRTANIVTSVKTHNDRVVLVRFADGTFTKSVCAPNDTFDIDTGIMVCLIKKLLGDGGTKIYNDALRHIHKVMDRNEQHAKLAKERKAQRKAENIRINAEKKAAKERKRQERIEEMAEAIKLANKKEESE